MKYFVSTPIYYVNAKPHIGHVYTTIAADVLARWQRARGTEVLFSTGTDENAQKNVEAAENAGREVKQYVDEMARHWEETFKQLNFSNDIFIRTTSSDHKQAVTALLKEIEKNNDIYIGDYHGLYCVGCEQFISENDLVDGKCPHHNTAPKTIKEKNYFFRLSKYREALLKHYRDNPDFVRPSSARNKMLHYIEHEMEDVSISRQSQEWGIALPQDPTHVVYVWFDALINYLTVTGYPEQKPGSESFWPADVHLIGKDIIKFHCAIWPAMLLSANLPLPKKVFAHGFFTVDGEKISKSLGNAIDPLELAKEYPFDAIRYYLLRDIPFGNDGDFSHQRLLDRYNADLANGLGNLVSRVLQMIEKFYPAFDPEENTPEVVLSGTSSGVAAGNVASSLAQVDTHLSNLAFDKALTVIWQAIAQADELIEQSKPWLLAKSDSPPDKGELEGVLTALYVTLVAINEKLAPFMPDTHKKLTELLEACPIKKPSEPLFARK